MANINLALLGAIDVATRVDRNLTARLKGLPLSKPQNRILLALAGLSQTTDSILAEQIGMTGPQLSRDVRPLIAQDLIGAEPSVRHQRQRLLSLTDGGRAAVEQINAVRLDVLNDVLPQLTPADRAALTNLFKVDHGNYDQPVQLKMRPASNQDLLAVFQKMTSGEAARKTHFVAQSARTLAVAFERWDGAGAAGVVVQGSRDAPEAFCLLIRGSLSGRGFDNDTMTLIGPYVETNLRGRGVAKKMLEHCIGVAKESGYEFLTTNVSTRTRDLEKFLTKRGFRKSRATSTPDLRDYVSDVFAFTRKLGK